MHRSGKRDLAGFPTQVEIQQILMAGNHPGRFQVGQDPGTFDSGEFGIQRNRDDAAHQ